ncbi:hypothetical protein Tco_1469537 [Tanacetum coccineum]
MEKDSEVYRGKKEIVKSIALKAKKESSDNGTSTSESDDEEYAMAVRNFKKFFRRKGKFVRQPREEKKVIVQILLATKIKRPLLEVLGAIAKIKPRTKSMMKLVSWLNRQMRGLLENEILELEEKIKILERNKAIGIGCESCQELRLENDKLKESQAKLVNDASKFSKFKQSTNSLKEMLDAQRSPNSKGGL